MLKNQDDWKQLFNEEIPPEFVIKPAWGVYGNGIHIFSKDSQEFVDVFGKSYNASDILEIMYSNSKFSCYIIQERLINHPELVRLSDTRTLQTARLITFVDKYRNAHIIYLCLKIVIDDGAIDNFKGGATGNLFAEIGPNGMLKHALAMQPNRPGITTVDTHPKTGLRFDDFQVPLLDEACLLAKETALKFLPIRQIGWDVAITPDGPKIVEGNMWTDPPIQHRGLDEILYELVSDK